MAMTRPDRELIAQVMLFSQGFRTAESLASKIVPFFNLCDEQLSPQPHYDFGLRALKAVLASAGILKRERLQEARSSGDSPDVAGLSDVVSEQVILIDRKSTRLNSSHANISYAVFCLKKKTIV